MLNAPSHRHIYFWPTSFLLSPTITTYPEIYLLIAIFAIGEQKSVLAKQCRMRFVTAKGQGCNSVNILHLKLL